MARADFPEKTPHSLGQFWQPDVGTNRVLGMLSIDGSRVRLQVSPELTPMFQTKMTRPGHGVVSSAQDPDDMVILGSMPTRPSKVTLWGAYTASRSQVGGMFLNSASAGLSRQEIDATWCIVGGHFPDPNTPFCGIRPDMTNLAEWARIPAISTETMEASLAVAV